MSGITAGLTGGIASGKSTAAEMFGELGAYIIDADEVSRNVTDGIAKDRIMAAFPVAYENGVLNRRKLRELVFADGSKREQLNGILHPLIFNEIKRLSAETDSQITIVMVPLLFETGYDSFTSPNITVSCDTQTRINRLIKRDDISVQTAENMLKAQMTDGQRAERADIVIYNDGNLARLRAQVIRVYDELKERIK